MSLTVEITSLAYGGRGVGRINGKVVFVPFTAPGDVAEVRITEDKKGFSIAELISVKEPSKIRTSPSCPVFTICGGCHLQHIEYSHQVEWKARIFAETLKRMAGLDTSFLKDPLPSPKQFNYRIKAAFHRSGKKTGFFAVKSHEVVDIKECPLLESLINETFKGIKNENIPAAVHTFEIALDIKNNKTTALFYLSENSDFDWKKFFSKVPLLKGYGVAIKKPFERGKGKTVIKEGDLDIFYESADSTLSSPAGGFSQTNPGQNKNLVENVVSYAESERENVVMDLFCGSGNLSLPLSKNAGFTVGVDSDKEAILYAKKNAAVNFITSIEFITERINIKTLEKIHRPSLLEKISPSVVILDPPRGGASEVVRGITNLGIKKVIYVSCAPPTLARDVQMLLKSGYIPYGGVILDMFPQTYHIESVMALRRKP